MQCSPHLVCVSQRCLLTPEHPTCQPYLVALCFLAIACGFCNASSDAIARLHDDQTTDNTNQIGIGISLSVALPPLGQWVLFNCGMAGTFRLPPIGNRQWIVPINMQVDYCNATWGRLRSSFSAYIANYDAGYVTVFWLIKPEGIYHSWDNLYWEERGSWVH